MMKFRKYIPIKIERADWSGGKPKEIAETRYLCFNNFTTEALLEECERRGLDPNLLQKIGRRAKESGTVELTPTETRQTTELLSVFLWAGFLTEADDRDEHLTVKQVGKWQYDDDPQALMEKIVEAMAAYSGEKSRKNGKPAAVEAQEGN